MAWPRSNSRKVPGPREKRAPRNAGGHSFVIPRNAGPPHAASKKFQYVSEAIEWKFLRRGPGRGFLQKAFPGCLLNASSGLFLRDLHGEPFPLMKRPSLSEGPIWLIKVLRAFLEPFYEPLPFQGIEMSFGCGNPKEYVQAG